MNIESIVREDLGAVIEFKSPLACKLFGCKPKDWEAVPDRFLSQQFDPSGIHEIHSHYRPEAIWPVYWSLAMANFLLGSSLRLFAKKEDDRETPSWSCKCERCGVTIWTFYPTTLNGRTWGTPDEYDVRVAALKFEQKFYGIDPWRA